MPPTSTGVKIATKKTSKSNGAMAVGIQMKKGATVDISESSSVSEGQWYTQEFFKSELDKNSRYDVEVIPESGDPDLYIWKNNGDVIRNSLNDVMQSERLSFELKDLIGSEDKINVSVHGYTESRFRITIKEVKTSIIQLPTCNANTTITKCNESCSPNPFITLKAEKHQDIEYVELYINNELVRRDPNQPYEWARPGNDDDFQLRNMKAGTYEAKFKIKDRCGKFYEKFCSFTVIKSGSDIGEVIGNNSCQFVDEFNATDNGNSTVTLSLSSSLMQEIRKVDYYKNNRQIGSVFQNPYTYTDNNGGSSSDTYRATISYLQSPETCDMETSMSNSDNGVQGDGCNLIDDFTIVKNSNNSAKLSISSRFLQEVRSVDYFKNGQQIGSVFQSPFTYFDNNASSGTSTYRASITFNQTSTKCEKEEEYNHSTGGDPTSCNWRWKNQNDICEKHFKHGEHWRFKMEPEDRQDIEWVEWYKGSTSSNNKMRRETSYPYEWDSRNSGDSKMRNWSEGRHKIIMRVKKRCHNTWYEKECYIHIDRHGNCNWNWKNRHELCDKHFKHGEHWRFKMEPEDRQDIEWVEWYKGSTSSNNKMRRETSYPYEWDSRNSGDSKMRNWSEGRHKIIMRVKKRCHNTWYEKECYIHIDRHGNCNWNWKNRHELCDKHFKHGEHWRFKMEPEDRQDIEWVEWYKGSTSSNNKMRRETSYPYEWDSRNSGDSKMRNWSEGRHKIIMRVKKRCHNTWYEKECYIHIDRHNNGNCNWRWKNQNDICEKHFKTWRALEI